MQAQPEGTEWVESDVGGLAAALDDTELMIRVKEGHEPSFALLLEKHRSSVVHFLYRMVQNAAVAEELAQEAFLRVYRSRTTYEPTAKFTTWLFRIATHLALNALRDGKHARLEERLDAVAEDAPSRQISDRAPTVEAALVKESRLAEVRRAIAALPGNQRAAVLMHKYQGMDYRQIGEVLKLSESATKSLLFRAYQTLRDKLKGFV